MTDENKGAETGDKLNSDATENGAGATNNSPEEIEKLKKEISTRDKVNTELQKKLKQIEEEKLAKDLASKTAEEKLAIFEKENREFKQREQFREVFRESGLDADEWYDIINKGDFSEQAKLIAARVTALTEKSANERLEGFKKERLDQVDKNLPKGSADKQEDAFTRGFSRGAK